MVARIHPAPDLYQRIGGGEVVGRIVDGLYDRIETDPELRPLFVHDLQQERINQRAFFGKWMGSTDSYGGYRGVRSRHRNKVTARGAGRWLRHFTEAMRDARIGDDLRKEVLQTLGPLARALVDDTPMLDCQSWYRKPAADAGKGDLPKLQNWFEDRPVLRLPGPSQLVMHQAARRGQLDVVKWLIDEGIDVNLPNCTQTRVAVTPLCMALTGKHTEIADLLRDNGAVMDVFTLAWLGEVAGLTAVLDADPTLVDIDDPAQDYHCVRPLEHAMERNKIKAIALLRARGATLEKGWRMLDRAISKRRPKLVKFLLDEGISTEWVSAGRWVADDKLAPMLLAAGADVTRYPSHWIEFCTGHHGNREQPDLIRKLLGLGCDIHARANKGRTALHCATRVGYTKVMQVLIDAGAEVNALDDEGRTPLGYVDIARPSADREGSRRVLLAAGAI